MKILIKNGSIVSPTEIFQADVLTDGERIAAVGAGLSCPDAEVVDAAGKLIFPGFIDAHTHFDLEVSGTVTADDFSSGTAAAAAGGTTCVLDFVSPEIGESLAAALDRWHKKADGRAFCDYGFHMSFFGLDDSAINELPDIFLAGVPTFKAYMTYDSRLTDAELERAAARLGELGGFLAVHCEDGAAIDANVKREAELRRFSPVWHAKTRPPELEAKAIARVSEIASRLKTPMMIVHLSTKAGLEAVKRNPFLLAETCPQYLLLDGSKYRLPEQQAQQFICSPPLRMINDLNALWHGVADGSISTVATDHCAFTPAQKSAGNGDFRKIPNGMPGAQTRPVLIFSEGVVRGRLDAQRMCAVLSENPARIYGMFPKKGVIAPGSDADIVVWAPDVKTVLSAETQLSRAGYCPYEGLCVTGSPELVLLRGSVAAEKGALKGAPRGRYIPRRNPEVF